MTEILTRYEVKPAKVTL